MADDLSDLVRRAHEGEVLGEALFAELVSLEPDPALRRKLFAAQLLEAQTKGTIEVLAAELSVQLSPEDHARDTGRRAGTSMAERSWEERMAAIAGSTGIYRSLYEELRALAPEPDAPALEELLAHERALNAFAAAEVAGDPSALDLLLAALDDTNRARVTAS